METNSVGSSITKPPNCQITFAMPDLPGEHCKVSMRIRAKDRGIVSRLKLGLLGWVPKKQWQGHYRVLARLLQEDIAKANSAIELAA